MPRKHVIYPPAQRPVCEVLVDDRWLPGEVRMWVVDVDGAWTADVGYSTGGAENRIGTFRADQLRGLGEDAHRSHEGRPVPSDGPD